MKKYGRTQKAAEETIRICIHENVLADYLAEKEIEVMDIMTALFDEEEVTRRFLPSVADFHHHIRMKLLIIM